MPPPADSPSTELLRHLPGVAFLLDARGAVLGWNLNAERLTGLAPQKLSGLQVLNLMQEDDRRHFTDRLQDAIATGTAQAEVGLVLQDGAQRSYRLWFSALPADAGKQVLLQGLDITDWLQMEARQREQQARLIEAQAIARLGSWEFDLIGERLHWSEEIYRILESSRTTAGPNYEAFLATCHPDDRERVKKACADAIASRKPYAFDHRLQMPDRRIKWVQQRGMVVYDAHWRPLRIIGTLQDITELKTVAWALGERVKEQRCLHEVSELVIRRDLSEDALLHETLAPLAAAFQYPEITAVRVLRGDTVLATPNFRTTRWRLATGLVIDGAAEGSLEICYLEERAPAAEGPFLTEERALIEAVARILGQALSARRKEAALGRVSRALRTLSACNRAMLHADSEQALYDEMCRVVVGIGGYRMAWIGLALQDEAKSVKPVAWAGSDGDYTERARISWADTERGRGPTGTAIREGVPVVNQDFAHNPNLAPWREQAAQHGFSSSAALPLREGDNNFGAFMIYAAEPNAFDADEMRLLGEMADDLSYGVKMLRLRKARESRA